MNKELKPEQITVICDTREQRPLDLSPLKSIRGTLQTADYSIVGLDHKIAIEKKHLQDLIACVGKERERFDREIQRLLAYETRAIFIIGSISQIENNLYRGQVTPNAILGSIMGWAQKNITILFFDTEQQCALMMSKYLYIAAKRYWRELYPFIQVQSNVEQSA